ncbi:hypothetical protein GCM10017673_41190 [Streptosporangium violaceochromogenes]|nr:hypothetical protein GCM10017673_41190 [Streptosporangium violaceochromogenes]
MPQIAPLEAGEPRRLGQFRVVGRIGEGGQGVVYLGENARGERAAIKLLHVKFSGDAVARSRFAREARAAQRVAPFCTAGVVDVDLEGDTPYIASEYIEGRSLREAVESDGPLRGAALQRLAIGTATALTAIHHAAIVHRDFKPDNVLLAADGPRVVDFGIARIIDSTGTITSRAIGTPAYMAPEQISGGDVGPHTDVFAWGATIVFAATGEAVFAGSSIAVVLNRILNHEVDVEALAEPLRGAARAALSKAPSERPSADRVLLRLLGHPEGASASPAVLGQGAQAADQVPASPGEDEDTDAGEATSPLRIPRTVPGPFATGGRPPPSGVDRDVSPGHRPSTGDLIALPGHQPSAGDLIAPTGHPVSSGHSASFGHPASSGHSGPTALPGRPETSSPARRPGRIGWIAVAVTLLLVASAGVTAYAAGWRPGFGAWQPGPTPTPGTTRFSSVVDKAEKTGRLTVGLRDFLPGIALNDGGRWEGFEVDLALRIAKRLGVPESGVTFRATRREERPALLASGAVDLVVSTYSINDTEAVTFAGPYYLAHVDVLVRREAPIASVADLEDTRICRPGGGTSVAALKARVRRLTPVDAANYSECVNLLLAGKIDAIPGDDLVLAGFANRESTPLRVAGLKLTDERYAVALRKGDRRACEVVREAIGDLYRDGTVGRLLDRYFSRVGFPTRERGVPARAGCG